MTATNKTALQRLVEMREQSQVQQGSSNPDILREMLLLLHAPESLSGCVKVMRNLRRIFGAALRGQPGEPDSDRFNKYLEELRWIALNAIILARVLFDDDNDRERFLRTDDPNPLIRHGAGEHSLWCLLWESHPERKRQSAFLIMQLHATVVHFEVLRYWTAREEWSQREYPVDAILHALYRETLAVRHFVMVKYVQADDYISVLDGLPADAPASDMYRHLKDLYVKYKPNADSAPSSICKDLASILWLLYRASDPDKFRARPKDNAVLPDTEVDDSKTGDGEREVAPPDSDMDEFQLDYDPDEDEEGIFDDADSGNNEEDPSTAPEIFVTTRHKWSAGEVKSCVESGLHPADALPTYSILLSNSKSARRGGRAWAEMDNQLLPWSRNNMPYEIAARGMNILKSASRSGRFQDLELYTRALVILRTGATEAAIRQMEVRSDQPSEVDVLTLVLRTSDAAGGPTEWLVPALPLPFRNIEVHRPDGCRECVPSFLLPDYSCIGKVMRRLIELKFSGSWNGEPVYPFDRDAHSYRRELREVLSVNAAAATETLRTIFTFSRLGAVHFQRIHDLAAGNTVAATYLTQRASRPGEVPRFYETPSVEMLQILDKRSITCITEELRSVGFDWEADLNIKPSDIAGYIGSPFCPTITELRKYISGLRQELQDISLRPTDGASFRRAHNLFSAYTYAAYNIATCHRAVEGGYTEFDRVEPRSKMMSIQDKGARERLVPVASPVWTQMREYQRLLLSPIYEQLFNQRPPLPMFFIDTEWRPQEIRPSVLRPHLPFPANFGRHFVRTLLAERNYEGKNRISIEHINELLGHAVEGEDRAGLYSSFSYKDYAAALRKNIADILNEIDYWPISFDGERLPVFDYVEYF